MSVLNLISDSEYENGTKKLVAAYRNKKIHFSKRGYTFLWLRKKDRYYEAEHHYSVLQK